MKADAAFLKKHTHNRTVEGLLPDGAFYARLAPRKTVAAVQKHWDDPALFIFLDPRVGRWVLGAYDKKPPRVWSIVNGIRQLVEQTPRPQRTTFKFPVDIDIGQSGAVVAYMVNEGYRPARNTSEVKEIVEKIKRDRKVTERKEREDWANDPEPLELTKKHDKLIQQAGFIDVNRPKKSDQHKLMDAAAKRKQEFIDTGKEHAPKTRNVRI